MMVGFISRSGQAYTNMAKATGKYILNRSGKPKLAPQEHKIIDGKLNCAIFLEWKQFLMAPAFQNGDGHIFITDKRIIFIRDIDLKAKLKDGSSEIERAYYRDLKSQGAREYFEIQWNEIKGYYPKRNSAVFYILSENEKYILLFFKGINSEEIIRRISRDLPSLHRFNLKKEVRNLDKNIESKKIYRFITPLSDQPQKTNYELLFWFGTMFTGVAIVTLIAGRLDYFPPLIVLGIICYIFTILLKKKYDKLFELYK